jgi:hypothetical protein
MDTNRKYHNRAQELDKLVKVLRDTGISNVEQLTKLLARTIQGYALQTGIEPLTKYELEYVWLKLLD